MKISAEEYEKLKNEKELYEYLYKMALKERDDAIKDRIQMLSMMDRAFSSAKEAHEMCDAWAKNPVAVWAPARDRHVKGLEDKISKLETKVKELEARVQEQVAAVDRADEIIQRDVERGRHIANAGPGEAVYISFNYDDYYPHGGWNDSVGVFSSLEKAKASANSKEGSKYEEGRWSVVRVGVFGGQFTFEECARGRWGGSWSGDDDEYITDDDEG